MKKAASSGTAPDPEREISLHDVVEVIHGHLTESLCETVFEKNRTDERRRKWTLEMLAKFWISVILRAPASLTEALEACERGEMAGTRIEATPEAFFQRCRDLPPKFFTNLYQRFLERALPSAPLAFACPAADLRTRFSEVWIIDGSRLDRIARRLKILRKVQEVVLPGCMTVCYDLFRGVARVCRVSTDAAEAEIHRAEEILDEIPRGTLLVGDRLYAGCIRFMAALRPRGIDFVFRRNQLVHLRKFGPTPGRRKGRGQPKDTLVQIGGENGLPEMKLRRIRLGSFEILTSVLDPKKLDALEAFLLYRHRWSIERLFYDLKEVLNLHRFYAGSPRTVVMQVFAVAIVHVAMRVAQARIAIEAGIQPEDISPAKFFPRLAAASYRRIEADLVFLLTQEANPGVHLVKPDWRLLPSVHLKLKNILVEKRAKNRRRPGFSKKRARWISVSKIRGAAELT